MTSYDEFDAGRVKHLEFIQAIIARLGNDAFLVKGWAVTVTGILLGFAVSQEDGWLAAVSAVPTLAFWGLDTYFLRAERLFRALYEATRAGLLEAPPFFMAATEAAFVAAARKRDPAAGSWLKTATRPTLWIFYTALLVAAALVGVAVC